MSFMQLLLIAATSFGKQISCRHFLPSPVTNMGLVSIHFSGLYKLVTPTSVNQPNSFGPVPSTSSIASLLLGRTNPHCHASLLDLRRGTGQPPSRMVSHLPSTDSSSSNELEKSNRGFAACLRRFCNCWEGAPRARKIQGTSLDPKIWPKPNPQMVSPLTPSYKGPKTNNHYS